jgi:hypothetical protein
LASRQLRLPLVNALDHGVADLIVGQVTPPNEDVRFGQDRLAQTVFRIVKRCRPGIDVGLLAQVAGNRPVDTMRVNMPDCLVTPFMNELIVNRYSNRHS